MAELLSRLYATSDHGLLTMRIPYTGGGSPALDVPFTGGITALPFTGGGQAIPYLGG